MVVEMATDKGNKKLDVDLRYACPLTSEVKSEGDYLIMKCNGQSMKVFLLHFMRWL